MKLAALDLNLNLKRTRKREFLEQMDEVVPWAALVERIAPYYPQGRTGRPPFSLTTMLRVCPTSPLSCVFAIGWRSTNLPSKSWPPSMSY